MEGQETLTKTNGEIEMKTIQLGSGFTVSGNSIKLIQSGYTVTIECDGIVKITKNFKEQWQARNWIMKLSEQYTFIEVK